jgi:hypothetical protein
MKIQKVQLLEEQVLLKQEVLLVKVLKEGDNLWYKDLRKSILDCKKDLSKWLIHCTYLNSKEN